MKKIMYAIYRKETAKYPEMILNRARDAQNMVGSNKTFWWGKTSYYKRVEIHLKGSVVDVYTHHRLNK